jgi:hypothetical protein
MVISVGFLGVAESVHCAAVDGKGEGGQESFGSASKEARVSVPGMFLQKRLRQLIASLDVLEENAPLAIGHASRRRFREVAGRNELAQIEILALEELSKPDGHRHIEGRTRMGGVLRCEGREGRYRLLIFQVVNLFEAHIDQGEILRIA